jgi:hypothetical protein
VAVRAPQPFAFPRVVRLPGWGVWSVSGDLLVLVRERSTICLIRHEPATLATVLDSIDPDGVLEVIEDDQESTTRIEVELGELSGQLRMLGDGGYLLMLGPSRDADLLDDVATTYLPQTRMRTFDEKPQKFASLARGALPSARVA